MKILPFEMERLQSTYEHQVEINLSESGVQPLRLRELVDDADLETLVNQELAYTQSNGTAELRAAIASMYPGATADHVEVTSGGSEANFVTCWHLVEPGDAVVVMHPNYMQTALLARAFGAAVDAWPFREALTGPSPRWRGDIDELGRLVTPRTKLIVICNPNNPTGSRLQDGELDEICRIANRSGAWVLADEIYRGAELDGRETPTLWGRYARVIVTSGLSKAYGLPGLRIGWIVAPPHLLTMLWSYHDYTTIAPSALGDLLARIALAPGRRRLLLERGRSILRSNYPIVREWVASHDGALTQVEPEAGAITFVRYRHAIASRDLVTRVRETSSVLLVPGEHFGMDGYVRIGYGGAAEALREGLGRLGRLLATIPY